MKRNLPSTSRSSGFGCSIIANAFPERRERAADLGLWGAAVGVGVAAGPVMGGVIGTTRLHYDVYGQCIKLAERIEASAEPGQVLMCEETYKLVHQKVACVSAGEHELKGIIGRQKLYRIAEGRCQL